MQRHLFDSDHDTIKGRQRGLFDGMPVESARECEACKRRLIVTESGYLCCPQGHGRLIPDSPSEE